jgi:hypothetical protein
MIIVVFLWFKWVPDQGPEQRESNLTVLCPLIIIILISFIVIYYIVIKLLIMQNHPSRNRKRNSMIIVLSQVFFTKECNNNNKTVLRRSRSVKPGWARRGCESAWQKGCMPILGDKKSVTKMFLRQNLLEVMFFLVEAGPRPRPRTQRVKNDCSLSTDYYNIN